MSKWAAMAGSNTAIIIAATFFASVAIGAGFYINGQLRSGPDAPVKATAQSSEPVTTGRLNETATPDDETDADAVEYAAPSIDEVRVEPDGLAIVAGRAVPGSTIAILLNGVENTTVLADADGGFAAITQIAPKSVAQVLTVVQKTGATALESEEEIILAPAPPAVARADISPDAETEAGGVPETSTAFAAPDIGEEVAQNAPQVAPVPKPDVVKAAPAERLPDAQTAAQAFAQTGEDTTPDPQSATSGAAAGGAVDRADATGALSTEVEAAERIATDEGDLRPDTVMTDSVAQDEQTARASAPSGPMPLSNAPQPVTVLKSTSEGVEVLGQRLGPTDTVAIDTISYSDAGEVRLAGRAKPDARTIRVYVDNRAVTELRIDAQGRWRGTLTDLATGVYTLRIDELDASGGVMSRVETPFKREDPDLFVDSLADARQAKQITVQTGATLWAIARERYGEGLLYVQVFEANRDSIRDPDLIYPGQVFKLPD